LRERETGQKTAQSVLRANEYSKKTHQGKEEQEKTWKLNNGIESSTAFESFFC
jgi:hypothetical protein